jgi:hypothetical protein
MHSLPPGTRVWLSIKSRRGSRQRAAPSNTPPLEEIDNHLRPLLVEEDMDLSYSDEPREDGGILIRGRLKHRPSGPRRGAGDAGCRHDLAFVRQLACVGGSQQGANTSRSRQQTNWAKGSMEWQDKQERKREAELLAAAADKS